jgi:hypothetical protein
MPSSPTLAAPFSRPLGRTVDVLGFYSDSYGKAPAMEVFVAPPPLKPRPLDAPLDGWDSVPIKDRQGWFQFVLPPEAPSLWTEIALVRF